MKGSAEFVVTVKPKGQVTIPVQVRRMLDIDAGDRIVFRVSDGAVEIEPAPMSLEDTFASVKPHTYPEDFSAVRNAVVEEHVQQVRQEMLE